MATFYQYLLAVFFSFLEIIFIFFKGYFLSIEFTLYPYLVSKGFVPYKNILDQHFPSLFFGTFSLPVLSNNSPLPLLILFVLALLLTNLLIFHYLQKKTKNSLLLLAIYIVCICYFSVNILWVETFVCLFIAVCLYLSLSKTKFNAFLIGIVASQICLLRPTLIPFCFAFLIYLNSDLKKAFLGLFAGLTASGLHFLVNNNFGEFLKLAFVFNGTVYSKVQGISPTVRNLVSTALVLVPTVFELMHKKKNLLVFTCLLSLLAVFPRFGLEHLQPFVLVCVILLSQTEMVLSRYYYYHLLITVFVIQVGLGLAAHRYGNYFYNRELNIVANKINQYKQEEIYLYGSSDLYYPLTDKIPPGKKYIPSLPWYLNYPPFQEELLNSLSSSSPLVLVDTGFDVDGETLVSQTPNVYEYIKMHYNLVDTEGNIEFYIKK